MKTVYTDEVGNRVVGFTVREPGVAHTLVKDVGGLEAAGADAWASEIELKVWLSRFPEFWGDGAVSATFLVADGEGRVKEVEVNRSDVMYPVDRWDLVL